MSDDRLTTERDDLQRALLREQRERAEESRRAIDAVMELRAEIAELKAAHPATEGPRPAATCDNCGQPATRCAKSGMRLCERCTVRLDKATFPIAEPAPEGPEPTRTDHDLSDAYWKDETTEPALEHERLRRVYNLGLADGRGSRGEGRAFEGTVSHDEIQPFLIESEKSYTYSDHWLDGLRGQRVRITVTPIEPGEGEEGK
jgi:hypothetical protein